MPFEVALKVIPDPPSYQHLAEKALHLKQLSLSKARIAAALTVDDKTIAKALRWMEGL